MVADGADGKGGTAKIDTWDNATLATAIDLDGRRIRVSQRPGLEGALIGTGFPFREHDHLDTYLAMLRDGLGRLVRRNWGHSKLAARQADPELRARIQSFETAANNAKAGCPVSRVLNAARK